MKTKLLYVIVSSPDDIYLEQAYVSMLSVRKHEPNAHIAVLMDSCTAKTLLFERKKLIELANEVIEIDYPENMSAKLRSRLLKTNARKYIEGDYLFIDTDTIVCGSLSAIDCIDAEIAAVKDANSHISFVDKDYIERRLKRIFDVKFDIKEYYYNSGIMYVKDCEATRNFYALWSESYAKCVKRGIFIDQLSLVYANYISGGLIRSLDYSWNTMLKDCSLAQLKQAKIIHYFNDGSELTKLNRKDVFLSIKEYGKPSEEIVQIIDDPLLSLAPDQVLTQSSYSDFFESSLGKIAYRFYKRDKGGFPVRMTDFLFRIYNCIKIGLNK